MRVPVAALRAVFDEDMGVAERDRLYPVGTFVEAVSVLDAEARPLFWVGFGLRVLVPLSAVRVMVGVDTRVKPVTALVPCG